MKTKYKNLYFDLDRTLWDFDTNASNTFLEILEKYNLIRLNENFKEGFMLFNRINDEMWELYRSGQINKTRLKTERFIQTLAAFNIHDDTLAFQMGEDYIKLSPEKTALMPGALETLDYLFEYFDLHVITNRYT